MQIRLQRTDENAERLFGRIGVDGVVVCAATLERPGVLPCGTYRWKKVISPKRGLLIIELEGVPGHTNIQLHIGNTLDNTEGCVLVGSARGFGTNVIASGAAYLALMHAVRGAETGEIIVESVNVR